ncbi:hypothetical protein [Zavarzinella formosa]|uniref:hypothetical protein n=1 Tax=Zavarzinella formosa TaxID=360055 RepID=UPI000316223D|nr:hypothetical protein [Zavarzinella formosa]
MALPTGEIVARPMVARACGCLNEFQHYSVDKYRTQRLAKFQSTRCAACVAKSEEAIRAAAAALPGKGEAIQALPIGCQIALARRADGKWTGTLTADGTTVETIADWPQGLSGMLARLWVSARGGKLPESGDVKAPVEVAPKPAAASSAKPPAGGVKSSTGAARPPASGGVKPPAGK